MAERITVLIVDDEPDLRAVVGAFIGTAPDMELAASVSDREGALAAAQRSHPAVAIVDVHIPGGGAETIREILAVSPTTRVVAYSGSSVGAEIDAMREAGAVDYVLKGESPRVLLEHIRGLVPAD